MSLNLSGTLNVWNMQADGQVNSTGGFLTPGIVSARGNITTTGSIIANSLVLTGSAGPLAVSQGGTGLSSSGANYNSLISNGTTWTSAPLIGSTWVALGNRSQGVTYTNDTGKWIQVCGNFGCNGGGQGQIYIDGALVSYWAAQFNGCGGFSVNMPCIIPAGSTYLLAAMAGGFRSWFELY